ncbi:MAG: efflux RND transporter periplasmic adaptor subunit [Chloroflexi bacterium]|nr:efflux RND transporter periplasmic adaptor subunit [Chloroflexota bacterium]
MTTRGAITAPLTYSGTVRARAQTNVVSTVAGRVARVYVDLGDEVHEGDPIAEIERGAFDAQVEQAEAAVRAAQARLNQVQAGAKPEDVEAAQATVRQAQSRLQQARAGARPEEVAAARAQVDQAQARLDALLAGPKPDDATNLDAVVDQARAVVDRARAELAAAVAASTEARYRLDQARAGLGGPNTRAEDIAAAQATLNAARSRLDQLRAGPRPEDVRAAELALTRAQAGVKAADAALEACGRSTKTTRSRVSATNSNSNESIETTTRERVSCEQAQRITLEQQKVVAQVAVSEAQNALDRTRNGATPFDIQQAEEAVRQAEATLQRTRFGGTTDLAALELRVGLAQADVERLKASLQEMQAKLESAQAQADSARNPNEFDVRGAQAVINQASANLARLVNPNPYDVESAQAQVEQAQAALAARQTPPVDEVEIAAAQVDQAVAALDAARFNQGQTIIRAPFDGLVVQRLISPGSAASPNTPIVTLVSRDVDVVIQVEESRINLVKRGQPAKITAAAFPGEVFDGTVTGIAPAVDALSRTFTVRVTPTDPNHQLRDGMAAQVALQTTERQALLVPSQAVVTRSGQTIVFVVGSDSRVHAREVQVGANNGQQTEIISGLSDGEEVATSSLDQLSDGTLVQVTRQQ